MSFSNMSTTNIFVFYKLIQEKVPPLGYFFSEEENEYRVYTCDNCKKYIKTIDTVKIDRFIYPPLEQVVTLHLDMQANQKGFESGLLALMSV